MDNLDFERIVLARELSLSQIEKICSATNKEIEVLNRYDIDYHTSIEELMFNLDEILNENDYEDLEEVSNSIAEFNYYHNTKK